MNKISIIYQNHKLLVVNKEAGLSVHNTEDPENLLLLLEKSGLAKKYFPIHRLDKDTSGIQLLALTSESARKYSLAFTQREVKKMYMGIVRGHLSSREGNWTQPLTDKAEGRKNPAGLSKERVPCETVFRVVQKSPHFSLCEFDLRTGRQHQIRKHSALHQHALVGDLRYGDIKYNENIVSLYGDKRMYLHCSHVEILGHTYTCPLPTSFARLIEEKTSEPCP